MNKPIGINRHKPVNLAAFTLAVVGIFGLLGAAFTANAQNLYSTSFEQPAFMPNAMLLGLDGWTTEIPPFLNPQAATITDRIKKSGKQSVVVPGASLVDSSEFTGPFYDAVGSYRRPLNYTITPAQPFIRIEADLLLATQKPKTSGEFFALNIGARTGNGETLGEVGIGSDGKVRTYAFDAPPGSPTVNSRNISLNKWYRIKMVYDSKQKTLTYFINDTCLGSIQTPTQSNVLLRAAMVAYAGPEGNGNTRSDYTAYFDNFRVSKHGHFPD